jgi:hypothetical protein
MQKSLTCEVMTRAREREREREEVDQTSVKFVDVRGELSRPKLTLFKVTNRL